MCVGVAAAGCLGSARAQHVEALHGWGGNWRDPAALGEALGHLAALEVGGLGTCGRAAGELRHKVPDREYIGMETARCMISGFLKMLDNLDM